MPGTRKILVIDENQGGPLQFKWRKYKVAGIDGYDADLKKFQQTLVEELLDMTDADVLDGCDPDMLQTENQSIVAAANTAKNNG